MTDEFDQQEWKRGQTAQAAQDRRHASKMAALARKTGGGKGYVFSARPARKKSRASRASRGQGSWTKAGKTPALLIQIHGGGEAGDGYAERQKGAQFIDSNMLGRDARERRAEFQLDTLRHPRVDPKNLFVHISLSRPPGEDLTAGQWRRVAAKFLRKIGADGCQFVCTRHAETKNDHLHLIFSRSRADGSLVSMSNNRWTWRAAIREVEAEMGITVAQRPADANRQVATSDAQVSASRRAQRRGTPSTHIDPSIIAGVLAQSSTPKQFAAGLKAAGIDAKEAEKNGKVQGILFKRNDAEEWLSGSSINREFSLPKIQAQIESNRQALLKREQELAMQRQREALDRQRQQAQAQQPRERY